MRGLDFWKRDSGGGIVIASYHSPHNMCWTWCLAFQRFRSDEARVWPLFWRWNTNTDRRWGARIPWIGTVNWTRQTRVMPYRDLYHSARDERDQLREQASRVPPRGRSPFQPTVIDGGQSVH